MTLFHRLCVWIGNLTGTLIVIPHPLTVGNTAEDIYFGLLKARRENRKLAILFPYQLPWLLKLPLTNLEVIAVTSDYMAFRRDSALSMFGGLIVTIWFGFFRGLSIVLQKFFGFHFSEWYTIPMTGQDILWKPQGRMENFSWEIVKSYDWPTQMKMPIQVALIERKRKLAEAERRRLGLPVDAWFVCLHVREPGYWNDAVSGAPRNADIHNYLDAIREITDRGGWVVRMGDASMKRLPVMERVIDYPFTACKNALMDVYLISECRVYIGMQSGILDVAALFQRPIIMTNMAGWLYPYAQKRGDLALFKHVFSRRKNRFLSVEEWLMEPWGATAPNPSQEDYVFHENSPDELAMIVREYFDCSEKWQPAALQLEFNACRLRRGREMLGQPIIASDRYSDMHLRYRFASRLDSCAGFASADYLRKNWKASSRNAGN
jgi:putative glycosyltransferase (TIGR04372 family)